MFGTTKSPFPVWLGLVYLPFGLMYVYPALKMWMYGSAIGRLVRSRAPTDLDAALGQQKSLWKFIGIVTVVLIAVYVVAIFAAVAVGFTQATHAK
jgi:dolichol kinase